MVTTYLHADANLRHTASITTTHHEHHITSHHFTSLPPAITVSHNLHQILQRKATEREYLQTDIPPGSEKSDKPQYTHGKDSATTKKQRAPGGEREACEQMSIRHQMEGGLARWNGGKGKRKNLWSRWGCAIVRPRRWELGVSKLQRRFRFSWWSHARSLSLSSSLCVPQMVDEALAERLGYFRPPSVHARLAGPPRVRACVCDGGCTALWYFSSQGCLGGPLLSRGRLIN